MKQYVIDGESRYLKKIVMMYETQKQLELYDFLVTVGKAENSPKKCNNFLENML